MSATGEVLTPQGYISHHLTHLQVGPRVLDGQYRLNDIFRRARRPVYPVVPQSSR